MKKTSTLTLTPGSCCTAIARIWSNRFAPSDAMSRRVLFFCLSLLIVAGSYTDMKAQCPGSNSGTGYNLGTDAANNGTVAPSTTCGTWVEAGACGSGSQVTINTSGYIVAHTYYDFEVATAGSDITAADIEVAGTGQTSPYIGWGSGTNTSITLGTYRTTAITCGTWTSNNTSSVLDYKYSTPTVSLSSGTGVGGVVTVCAGYVSPNYAITTAYVDASGSTPYAWTATLTGTATCTFSSATASNPTATFGGAGTVVIKCTVSNNGKCTGSASTSTITVVAIPSLTAPSPSSQTVCQNGASTAITTSASGGTGTITYQWWSNTTNSNSTSSATNLGAGSGAQTLSYTPPTSTIGTLYYFCVMTATGSGCTTYNSATASVTVVAIPSLTAPSPSSQTDCNGATPTNITTSVVNAGTGTVSYQWYSVGSNANSGGASLGSGSGAQTLTFTPPTTANGTEYYYCVISATGSGCTSAPSPLNDAQVIVDAQPTIFSQGASSNTPCQGVASTLSAAATNSVSGGTFSYQWYYNATTNSTTGGSAISGASGSGLASNAVTTYTLSTSNVTTALPGPGGTGVVGGPYYYYCVFTPSSGTGCNSTTTSAIGITVEPNQIITLTSAAGSDNQAEFCEGTPLPINIVYTLSGGATGASTIGLPAGITGSLSGLTYTISGTPTVNGTFNYFVETSGSCSGTVASGTITISPTNQAIPGSPTFANVCAATNATYTVSSGYSSSGGGTVLWTSSSTSGSPGGITAGSTGYTPQYTFSTDEQTNGATITLTMTVSNPYCADATTTFTINAFGATAATPGGTTSAIVCAATSPTYTVPGGYSATNGTILWTRSSTSGTPGSITGGSTTTTPTYTFSTDEVANGATITLTMTVSNAGCASSTTTFVINAYGAPTATASGITSANVCAATTPSYTVPSSDYSSTNGTVLWTSSSTSGTPGSITAGSTGYTPTYTFSPDEVANSATITLTMTVSNVAGCTSATATFTITTYPGTTATPGSTTSVNLCAATHATYTVPSGYSSTGGTILWTSSSTSGTPGSITAGATGTTPTYTFSTDEVANGATITLTMTVSNPGGCTSSTTFTINAYGAPTETDGSTTSANVCGATSGSYTVPAGYSSTNGTVLWTSSSTSGTPGSITAGATGYTPTYTFSTDEITNGATITLTITVSNVGGCRPATSTFTINVYGATAATPGSTTSAIVCATTSSTYTVPSGYTATNGTILWTSSSTSGSPGSITAGSTTATPTYTFSANEIAHGATITLTMTVSNLGGCTPSTTTFTINAYGGPTATAGSTTSAVVCAGTSSTYTVPSGYSSTNGTVLWTSSSTSGTPGSITAGATGYTPTYTFSSDEISNGATVTLTMTVSNVAGCTPATSTFVISAYPATSATAGSTTSDAVCSNTSSYTVPSGYSSGTGSTVVWTASSTSGSNGTISGGTGYTPTYTFSTADKTSATAVTVTLTMTASNGGCASSTATFTLTISPTPALSNQSSTQCSSVTFTYTPSGGIIPSGTSYSWSTPTGSGFSGSSGAGSGGSITDNLVNTTSSPVTATYSVTPTAGSCTGTAFNVAVTLNPSPSAASISSVFDQCNGGWAAQVNITGGTSPYNFTLTYGGTPYSLTNKTVPYDQDLGGATTATLTAVTDANGCPSSTAITGSPVTLPSPTATLSTLSAGSNSATCVVTSGIAQTFFDASANLMVQITPTANLGSTQVIITNDGSPGEFGPTHLQHYLQRHIQIIPTNQATANVCIYMADGEVDALATISGSSDIHTAPVSYGTFPTSGVSPTTFLAGARIMQYDGASETPPSHTTETILTGYSATHNPTVDGVTYSGVWQLCYSSGFSGFYVYAGNSTGDPLPVTLVSFTAEAVNNQYIELNWVTASEINNSGFQIERSIDGTNYQSIGWVEGHGTSTVTNDYMYSDLTAIPGIVYYYRLKQVDVDGNFAYSNIASASLTGDKGFTLTGLYPNPATSQVSIGVISNVSANATVKLTDILGRDVLTQDWTLSVGYNTNVFDVSSMAAGTYVVTIQSGNAKATKHLVITK